MYNSELAVQLDRAYGAACQMDSIQNALFKKEQELNNLKCKLEKEAKCKLGAGFWVLTIFLALTISLILTAYLLPLLRKFLISGGFDIEAS